MNTGAYSCSSKDKDGRRCIGMVVTSDVPGYPAANRCPVCGWRKP